MKQRMIQIVLVSAVMGWAGAAFADCGQEYCLDWSTIDNGGVIESSSTDSQWGLSASIAQVDASAAFALTSGQWRLTGGFWSAQVGELSDDVYEDRFEDQ